MTRYYQHDKDARPLIEPDDKLVAQIREGLRDHVARPSAQFYECGEGYAHPVGQACTGQCVLRG